MNNTWLVIVAVTISSCSLKIPLSHGRAAYIGVITADDPNTPDNPIQHIQRYGVAAEIGTAKTGVLVGYQDSFTVKPRTNEVLDINYRYTRGIRAARALHGSIRRHD